MKKIISLVLATVLLLSLSVCGLAESAGNTAKTNETTRVYTEGTYDYSTLQTPVLITSFGQSADVSMLNALFKKLKNKVDYTFAPLATAEEVANYKTVVIAAGMSSKGLGAAGISEESEFARAEAIVQTIKDKGITVIFAHLGGASRRGAKSDQFADLVLSVSSYLLFVEAGDLSDHKFSNYALNNNIPYTTIYTIVDALQPLNEMF